MKKLIFILIILLPSNALALAVFPGAVGFGTDTIAGRGGTVIKVTNLNDSGAGSFRAAVTSSGARIVVFEVSGTIEALSNIYINNPYITVAGQTAPSPGITLKNARLNVNTHDVLLQHIRVRVGGDTPGDPQSIDGIQILSDNAGVPVYNVVVDHCSVSWGLDENIEVYETGGGSTYDVTVSNTIISEALHNPTAAPTQEGFGMLVGQGTERVSITNNLFSNNFARAPKFRADKSFIVNNVTHDGAYPMILRPEGAAEKFIVYRNIMTTDTNTVLIWGPATVNNELYIYDNEHIGETGEHWDGVDNDSGVSSDAMKVTTVPFTDLALPTRPRNEVEAYVLANAGARPADRDSVDDRAVYNVENNITGYPSDQSDVGGWPVLAENTRTLTVPANPSGDDDADGYTNVEEWIFGYSAAVEGTAVAASSSATIKASGGTVGTVKVSGGSTVTFR